MKRIYERTFKRALLSIIIVLFSMVSFASTYYVSNTGNDANSGLTTALAWQTLNKVNSMNFVPGDQILFQRGNVFYGSLTIKNSGTSGNTIKLNAYGTGNNPIIGGFTTIGSWVNYGNGIYYATVDVPKLNIVTLDGALKGMGRFPERGYLSYESHNAKTSITDDQLVGSPNWTGAEVCIRKYRWIIDRHFVTNHSGGTLTYSSNTDYGNATLYEPLDKNGYFIQNHIGCLNDLGDWSYNGSEKRIYMYFGTGGPTGHTVNVGSLDKNLTISDQSFVDVSNIDFEGANINGLYITGSNNLSITGCNIKNQGGNAIYGLTANYIRLSGGSIVNALNNGIFFEWDVNNVTVDGLTVNNVGNIPGASRSGDGSSIGMYIAGNNTVVRNCKVTNTGYNAINFNGDNALVENNTVDTYCTEKDDGAGIYTYTGAGKIIRNNIVLNAIGAYAGAEWGYWEPFGKAAAIYLDNGTANHNATITGNSLANGDWAGIFINDNGGNTLQNNTVYNFREQLLIIEFSLGKVRNINITGNQFIAKSATQKTLFNQLYVAESPSSLGIFNDNYYARPMDDNLTIQTSTDGNTLTQRTLDGWKSYSGQDANSKKSPQSITSEGDLQFEYNATQSAKTVSLSRPMIDFKGMKYQGSITLQPFTSIVLMKDNSVTTVLPVVYSVTGGGSYTSGGTGVPVGLSNSQTGVNYQLKLGGVNDGSPVAGLGTALSFGNKTIAGVYTVSATSVSGGTTINMAGSATVTVNPATITVTSLTVSPTSTSISVNATQQLTATVLPTDATNKTVTWSSSNTAVATVNSLGLVTGISAGSAIITATTQDGGKTATSSIAVTIPTVAVTGVTVSPTSASISVNSTKQLTATVLPTDATNKTITWSSSNTTVATVNNLGLVTGLTAGNVVITATTQDGGKIATSSIAVTIPTVAVTGVTVSPTSASILVNSTKQLTAAILPTDATNKTVTWSSSNTAVATVNNLGLVTGISAGSAIITVTTQDGGKTATCSIAVTIPTVAVTGVTVSPTSASILVNSTKQLTAAILPTDATNKTVTWSSSNTTVATVNNLGLVTGISAGSAIITVTTQDGGKTATSSIAVTIPTVAVTGVTVNPTSASISVNSTTQLTATIIPADATNKTVTWNSSNTAVATVNNLGLVTGISAGSAIITVTTQDGGKATYCSVAVSNPTISVSGVTLNPTSLSLSINDTQQLTATVIPADATNKTVTWNSSNTAVATVNNYGVVTGVSVGSAIITVTTQEGGKTSYASVTVNDINTAYLGYNVKGAARLSCGAGTISASQYIANSSFTATTMYVSLSAGYGKLKGAIYSDKLGSPGVKLGETFELSNITAGGFIKLSGLNVTVVSGSKYWLVVWSNSPYQIDCENSGGKFQWKSAQKYSSFPYNFRKSDGSSIIKCSIYVEGGIKSANFDESAMESRGLDYLKDFVKIDVFPNPSAGKVTVRFSSAPEVGSKIEILDISGRKIETRLISGVNEEFDLEKQPKGIYLVKLVIGRNESIQKLIIN